MLNVNGVGQVKFAKYGEPFLAITRTVVAPGHPAEPSAAPRAGGHEAPALAASLAPQRDARLLQGRPLHRGDRVGARVAISTIATHLAQLIHFGYIRELSALVEPGLIERVRAVAGDGPIKELAPLREALGGDVPYEQLHIARAWLQPRRPMTVPPRELAELQAVGRDLYSSAS